jgi:hypothetical protein
MTKDEALGMFDKYFGFPDQFETEFEIFNEWLDMEPNPSKEDVIDKLEQLIEGLTEDDNVPRIQGTKLFPNERLTAAIEAAKALLNKS